MVRQWVNTSGVKVRMGIKQPLMRGIKVEQEEEGEGVQSHAAGKKPIQEEDDRCWCPFEYEFLPEFCYVCGMLGHKDKMCKVKLKRGEKAQFGPWMRAFMPRRSGGGARGRWGEGGAGRNGRFAGSRSQGAW